MRQEQVSYENTRSFNFTLTSLRGLRVSNAHLLSGAMLIVLFPIAIFAAHLSLFPQIALLLGGALSAYLIAIWSKPGSLLSSGIDWRVSRPAHY